MPSSFTSTRLVSWCAADDNERHFVYSPRFSTAYLLDREHITNEMLLIFLGLRQTGRVSSLDDPVHRVGLCGNYEKDIPPADVRGWALAESEQNLRALRRWYRLFHRHRRIFAPLYINLWAHVLSTSINVPDLTLDRIARLLAVTEHYAAISDCYPRALLLGALCAIAGLQSTITIGILAPTRKLHAWCSSDGALIYEPTPRHWWYRPLIAYRSGPANGP